MITQPFDIDTERALIGSIILDNSNYLKIKQIVPSGSYFYDTHLSAIYTAILDLNNFNIPMDIITIRDKVLKAHPDLPDIAERLVECSESVATPANGIYYAKIIRDKYVMRGKIAAASKIMNQTDEGEAQGEIDRLSGLLSDKPSLEEIAKLSTEEIMMSFDKPELTTGVDYIDYFSAGLQRKKMTTFAGRTNQGKTAWAIQATAENLQKGKRIAYYTFDITAQDIMKRLVGYIGGIDTDVYIKPWKIPDPNDRKEAIRNFESIMSIINADYKDKLIIRTRPSWEEINGDIAGGVDIVFIDYIQVAIVLHQKTSRYGLGQDDWIEYLDKWKTLAEKYNFALVPLSQFKRADYEARGKPPDMEDLKQSGYIETSSHTIVGLWWEWMEDPKFPSLLYSFRVFKANGEKTNGWDYIKFNPPLQRLESGDEAWREQARRDVIEYRNLKRRREK